jgi:hypothetical protein
MNELTTYNTYKSDQLAAMQKVYYAGKANKWQSEKYELVCSLLLAELRQFNPEAKPASACYLHAAIGACLYNKRQEEKKALDSMRAAAQLATTQLKAWKWEGLK